MNDSTNSHPQVNQQNAADQRPPLWTPRTACDCERLLTPLSPDDKFPDHVCPATAERSVVQWARGESEGPTDLSQYTPWPLPVGPRAVAKWNDRQFPSSAWKREQRQSFPPAAAGVDWLALVVSLAGRNWRIMLFGSALVAFGNPTYWRGNPARPSEGYWEPKQMLHVVVDNERGGSLWVGHLMYDRLLSTIRAEGLALPSPSAITLVHDQLVIHANTREYRFDWVENIGLPFPGMSVSGGTSWMAWQFGPGYPLIMSDGPTPSAATDELERLSRWYNRAVRCCDVGDKPGRKPGQAKALRHLSAEDIAADYQALKDAYWDEGERSPTEPDLATHYGVSVSTLRRRRKQVGLGWPPILDATRPTGGNSDNF